MPRDLSDGKCLRRALAFLGLLLVAVLSAFNSDRFDRPLAQFVNGFVADHGAITRLAFAFTYPSFEGLVIMSLIWALWFTDGKAEPRARIISGIFAAVLAGLVAHYLHDILPTPPKPIFDPALSIKVPAILGDIDQLRATSNPTSHRFPSERATLFAGLAVATFIAQRRIGLLALACVALVELSRIYLGLHYPMDIVGSIALAAAVVWIGQMRWGYRLGVQFLKWENLSPATFYMCAFFVSYQIATAFDDVRGFIEALLS